MPVFNLKARNNRIFVPIAVVTQLSTGSVAAVCQYTDIDTNSRHSATAVLTAVEPNPDNSCTVIVQSRCRCAENEELLQFQYSTWTK